MRSWLATTNQDGFVCHAAILTLSSRQPANHGPCVVARTRACAVGRSWAKSLITALVDNVRYFAQSLLSAPAQDGVCWFFFLMMPEPPRSTLCPYTTLCRSRLFGFGHGVHARSRKG